MDFNGTDQYLTTIYGNGVFATLYPGLVWLGSLNAIGIELTSGYWVALIEPQELDLPTFGKKPKKKKLSEKKLEISFTKGISDLYDGFKLKEDVGFSLTNIIFPLVCKNHY